MCLGCIINNSAVYATINKCTYAKITSCEQKVTVCMCYIKKLVIVHMLQLLLNYGMYVTITNYKQ